MLCRLPVKDAEDEDIVGALPTAGEFVRAFACNPRSRDSS